MNHETLKLLKDEERKIVLTITADENDDQAQHLIKLLKAAASANRDLVFAYVGVKQWEDFADKFGADEKTKLPKMIVWNGDQEYFSVSINPINIISLILMQELVPLIIAGFFLILA